MQHRKRNRAALEQQSPPALALSDETRAVIAEDESLREAARVRARHKARREAMRSDPMGRLQLRARKMVERALAAGRLVRQPCEACGSPRAHAHHDDYDRPLDVRWLCQRHHNDIPREPRGWG